MLVINVMSVCELVLCLVRRLVPYCCVREVVNDIIAAIELLC